MKGESQVPPLERKQFELGCRWARVPAPRAKGLFVIKCVSKEIEGIAGDLGMNDECQWRQRSTVRIQCSRFIKYTRSQLEESIDAA